MDPRESSFTEAGLRTKILRSMTPRQRQNMALDSIGYKHRDIAEMMEISEQTSINTCFNVRRFKLANLWDRKLGSNFPVRLGIVEPMMAWNVFCVSFSGLPPSANSAYPNIPGKGARKGRYISREAKEWKKMAFNTLLAAGLDRSNPVPPLCGHLGIHIYLHIPAKYNGDGDLAAPNWDTDNRTKIVLDSFKEAGIFPDDRWVDTVKTQRCYSDAENILLPMTEVIAWEQTGVDDIDARIDEEAS